MELSNLTQLHVLGLCARGRIHGIIRSGFREIQFASHQSIVETLMFRKLVKIKQVEGSRVTAYATPNGLEELDYWCERIWPEAASALQESENKTIKRVD